MKIMRNVPNQTASNYAIDHVHLLLQIVSLGTFQVLKLPLGFIRVLEWVSVRKACVFLSPFFNSLSFTFLNWQNKLGPGMCEGERESDFYYRFYHHSCAILSFE